MSLTRRVKIFCTMGPAPTSPERIRGLVEAGMDVARLNFSHGTRADHEQVYSLVRQASDTAGRAVAVLADLQGPKIRLGKFADGAHEGRPGGSGGAPVPWSSSPATTSSARPTASPARIASSRRR